MSNAFKLKNLESPKVGLDEDYSTKVLHERKKLRDFAKEHRRENERFTVRYNKLHMKSGIYRYDSVSDHVIRIYSRPERTTKGHHEKQGNETTTTAPISLLVANFRSIFHKLDILKTIMHTCFTDILIGTVTWLSEDIASNELTFSPNFVLFHRDIGSGLGEAECSSP